jgi:hypothetical protein
VLAPLDSRTLSDDSQVRTIVDRLALDNPSVLEAQVEDVSLSALGHGIELDEVGASAGAHMQEVADTSQIALTTVETANASKSLLLRQFDHLHTCRVAKVTPELAPEGLTQ